MRSAGAKCCLPASHKLGMPWWQVVLYTQVAVHGLLAGPSAPRVAAGAQVLSEPDVGRFVASAHLLTAPGGTFFGSTGGSDQAGAHRPGVLHALPQSARIA